eukprot:COSAG06_NODE_25041_length_647_cov_0.580292_1_plen_25_part_01
MQGGVEGAASAAVAGGARESVIEGC